MVSCRIRYQLWFCGSPSFNWIEDVHRRVIERGHHFLPSIPILAPIEDCDIFSNKRWRVVGRPLDASIERWENFHEWNWRMQWNDRRKHIRNLFSHRNDLRSQEHLSFRHGSICEWRKWLNIISYQSDPIYEWWNSTILHFNQKFVHPAWAIVTDILYVLTDSRFIRRPHIGQIEECWDMFATTDGTRQMFHVIVTSAGKRIIVILELRWWSIGCRWCGCSNLLQSNNRQNDLKNLLIFLNLFHICILPLMKSLRQWQRLEVSFWFRRISKFPLKSFTQT